MNRINRNQEHFESSYQSCDRDIVMQDEKGEWEWEAIGPFAIILEATFAKFSKKYDFFWKKYFIENKFSILF